MKKFIKRALIFILIPFLISETFCRWIDKPFWMEKAIELSRHEHLDYIFLGSSRVAAAIDKESFDKEMSSQLGYKTNTINFGMGYTSNAEYFLGLKKLIANNPTALKGTTVFLEAPGNIPSCDSWQNSWVLAMPHWIVPFMSNREVIKLWRESETDLEDKIYISLATYSATVYRFSFLKYASLGKAAQLTSQLLEKMKLTSSTDADLSSDGGIRIDKGGIALARNQAVFLTNEEINHQQPIQSWDKSILKDIITLVNENGGHIVLFNMPLSSIQEKPYQTKLRKADKELFEKKAQEWGISILQVSFQTDDSDFPDLWHLKRSRSIEFTQLLAQSYLKLLRPAPPGN